MSMLSQQTIQEIWVSMCRRVETIKMAGGVARWEVMEGKAIPEGFVPDLYTDYWIPPNLIFEDECRTTPQ